MKSVITSSRTCWSLITVPSSASWLPAGGPAHGRGGDALAVGRHARPVKRGLDEPPLAQPEVALGEQQPVAEQRPEQPHAGALDEVAAPRHQHLFDRVRMVEEHGAARAEAHGHDVAVPRAADVEAELVALEVAQTSEEPTTPRSAKRSRHPT